MVEITRPYRRTAHLIGPALVKHCNNRRKVADDLGIGIKAVHNYCRGLEIPANNARTVLTDEQIAEALARNGLRRRPTANELHCSERRIDSYCDRNHVPRPPKCKKSVASYNPPIKWNAANVSRVRAMTSR